MPCFIKETIEVCRCKLSRDHFVTSFYWFFGQKNYHQLWPSTSFEVEKKVGDDLDGGSRRRESKDTYACCVE